MATYTATATGNWSTMTWSPSGTPGAGDIVEAGAYTVTIDQNITVASIRTTSGGGTFNVTAARTLTCDVIAGSTACLNISHGTGTVTINGNVTGGSASNARGVNTSGAGTTVVNGNVTGGSASGCIGLYNTGSGTITITGSAIPGTGASCHGARNTTGTLSAYEAQGNNFGPGGGTTEVYGLYGSGASATTKVTRMIWGTYGACPIMGAVLLTDDSANNLVRWRLAAGGATRDLTAASAGGGASVIGSPIIRGV